MVVITDAAADEAEGVRGNHVRGDCLKCFVRINEHFEPLMCRQAFMESALLTDLERNDEFAPVAHMAALPALHP